MISCLFFALIFLIINLFIIGRIWWIEEQQRYQQYQRLISYLDYLNGNSGIDPGNYY